MQVSELIVRLGWVDPDMEVVLARDEEGNWFSLLDQVKVLDSLPSGKFHPSEITMEGKKILVLWPTD